MDTTTPSQTRPELAEGPDVVAETMRRVHAELKRGRAPSFESLLALGEPSRA